MILENDEKIDPFAIEEEDMFDDFMDEDLFNDDFDDSIEEDKAAIEEADKATGLPVSDDEIFGDEKSNDLPTEETYSTFQF